MSLTVLAACIVVICAAVVIWIKYSKSRARRQLEQHSITPDETSRRILQRALAMHSLRIKLLKGGLAAWKAKGYPVEPYTTPFYLDVRT